MDNLPEYATNLAIINNGIVANVIWGYMYQASEFGETVIAVDNRLVQIGDTYDSETGKFYHDGEEVKTIEEIMEDMQAALEMLGVGNDE